MKTFKQLREQFITPTSASAARKHSTQVKAQLNSTRSSIANRMNDFRELIRSHQIHKSVHTELGKDSPKCESAPDYGSIDVDIEKLHHHVSNASPTKQNIKKMHDMVKHFANKHEMDADGLYTLVKNSPDAHPDYKSGI